MITWEERWPSTWWVRDGWKLRLPEVREIGGKYFIFPNAIQEAIPTAGPFETLEAAKTALLLII